MANTGAVVLLIIVLRAHTATMGQPLVKGTYVVTMQLTSYEIATYDQPHLAIIILLANTCYIIAWAHIYN